MNKISNKKIGIIVASGWSALGFYRGLEHYVYTHNERIEKYERDSKYFKDRHEFYKPTIYFTSFIASGVYGSLSYITPGICFFYFAKEFYRTEVYLRGLDSEKERRYYNTLDITGRY